MAHWALDQLELGVVKLCRSAAVPPPETLSPCPQRCDADIHEFSSALMRTLLRASALFQLLRPEGICAQSLQTGHQKTLQTLC
jgi:hypothetical protein